MELVDPQRRTGRTFRMLLKAILAASEGGRVRVVCYSADYARDLHRRALHICPSSREPDHRTIDVGQGRLRFSGPLTQRDEQILARNGVKVFYDHYRGEGLRYR